MSSRGWIIPNLTSNVYLRGLAADAAALIKTPKFQHWAPRTTQSHAPALISTPNQAKHSFGLSPSTHFNITPGQTVIWAISQAKHFNIKPGQAFMSALSLAILVISCAEKAKQNRPYSSAWTVQKSMPKSIPKGGALVSTVCHAKHSCQH